MSQPTRATPWKRLDCARPLLAWRDAELASVALIVQESLQAWRQAWGLDAEPPLVRCTPATATDAPLAWRLVGCAKEGSAWLALPPDFEHLLVQALWGRDEVASPLAQRVLGACGEDLTARLLAGLCMAPAAGPAPAPPTSRSTWSGQVTVHLDGGSRLLLDGAAVASLLGRARPGAAPAVAATAPPPLISIAGAASGMRLTLQARLADCELDLASLQGLCVGDIVPVHHRLDEPLQVRDAAGQLVFGGFLARRGQRKALELAPPSTPGAQRP